MASAQRKTFKQGDGPKGHAPAAMFLCVGKLRKIQLLLFHILQGFPTVKQPIIITPVKKLRLK